MLVVHCIASLSMFLHLACKGTWREVSEQTARSIAWYERFRRFFVYILFDRL